MPNRLQTQRKRRRKKQKEGKVNRFCCCCVSSRLFGGSLQQAVRNRKEPSLDLVCVCVCIKQSRACTAQTQSYLVPRIDATTVWVSDGRWLGYASCTTRGSGRQTGDRILTQQQQKRSRSYQKRPSACPLYLLI